MFQFKMIKDKAYHGKTSREIQMIISSYSRLSRKKKKRFFGTVKERKRIYKKLTSHRDDWH